MDVKTRYANHYGLKGAFIFTVQSDDFLGQFGHEKYGLLSSMNKALVSGLGLRRVETHGAASENKNCRPDYATCRERLTTNSEEHITSTIFLTAVTAYLLVFI